MIRQLPGIRVICLKHYNPLHPECIDGIDLRRRRFGASASSRSSLRNSRARSRVRVRCLWCTTRYDEPRISAWVDKYRIPRFALPVFDDRDIVSRFVQVEAISFTLFADDLTSFANRTGILSGLPHGPGLRSYRSVFRWCLHATVSTEAHHCLTTIWRLPHEKTQTLNSPPCSSRADHHQAPGFPSRRTAFPYLLFATFWQFWELQMLAQAGSTGGDSQDPRPLRTLLHPPPPPPPPAAAAAAAPHPHPHACSAPPPPPPFV